MTSMALFLEPLDVWLFRDGRPFDAGDDHYARTLFPPFPTVTQGVIRSHHLRVKGIDLNDKLAVAQTVGTATSYGALRLRGPFVARRTSDIVTRYFPLPADAVPAANGMVKPAQPRATAGTGVWTCWDDSLPLLLFPADAEPRKLDEGAWLSERDLWNYLHGQAVQPCPASELFIIEHRYGISIQKERNRVVEEGKLYAAEFVRPADGVGLYLEIDGYDGWPSTGVLRIGGEGHAARFKQVPALSWPDPPDPLPQRFKVIFVTPTYFAQGWKPLSWSAFFDGSVTLKAVAIRRYEARGGFDYADGAQKPARRYVPAGSMYYFESDGRARLKSDLINSALTDNAPEIGFGLAWIAPWT